MESCFAREDLTPASMEVVLLSMRTRVIHDDDLFAHFVTFSCYRRRRVFIVVITLHVMEPRHDGA